MNGCAKIYKFLLVSQVKYSMLCYCYRLLLTCTPGDCLVHMCNVYLQACMAVLHGCKYTMWTVFSPRAHAVIMCAQGVGFILSPILLVCSASWMPHITICGALILCGQNRTPKFFTCCKYVVPVCGQTYAVQ